MININSTLPLNTNLNNIPSFRARNINVREITDYFEKLKINNKVDRELNKLFYNLNQPYLPKFLKKMFITLENFASLSVTPFIDIKKYDILGVFDDKGKILGGLVGKKEFGRFQITGLYLDKTIQRTKDSAKTLKILLEKIKKLAQRYKVKIITCEAYKKAPTTIKLYKKVGFEEFPIHSYDINSLSTKLYAKIENLGKNFNINKY